MKIYLSSDHECPSEYDVHKYWPVQVIDLLEKHPPGEIENICLEYDLGNPKIGTGFDLVYWLCHKLKDDPDFVPPGLYVKTKTPGEGLIMDKILTIFQELCMARGYEPTEEIR